MSLLHYKPIFGIKSKNPHYNLVGFGLNTRMTGTDKIALNLFLSCPTIKKQVFAEFKQEEIQRNYIELLNLPITPNEASQRCVMCIV